MKGFDKNEIFKKILAAVLAALMAISMMPFTAFAQEWTDEDVWGPDLQTGDILTSNVESVHGLEEYTLTLLAGGYGDESEEVANSDLVITEWNIHRHETPEGNTLMIDDMSAYGMYFPYNADGMTNQWYVVDVNHDNETIVLSGFVPSIPTVNTYTATWKNYDGAVLKTDEEIEEGTTPTYFGKMPAKPSTDTHFYAFSGWTPAVEPIEEDTTYTATFTEMAKSSAVDGCETFVTKSFEDTREFVGEHIRAKNSKVTATDYGWSANNNFRTTVEGRNGEKIVKLVLTRASSYGAAPVVYVNDTAVSGTLSGDVYTFDNLNATYVHIGTGSNVWFDFTDLVAYYKKAEVSETISLAYAPLSTISGTHYTVSADNLVGESALTINDMHPMTINARKGETITKVVLTYRTGDDKDTLSASSGTFDGDATFSNINAQQVTISSWENVDISGVTVYFDGDINDPTVTLTGGANAKSSGGLSTQSYLPGAMDTVTYTALADATFPEFETYTLNGVTVERTSDTVVTVSGTPTENTAITVPDAESSSKIVTWNATLLNDYIADEISDGNGYSDTANGITLTTSEGEVDYFGNSYLETYDGTTLSFSTAAGKFTSIEIEANNIYDGGNWTKDGNILKWNGTPSESVSLTGDVFIMGLSSITFVIEPNTYTVTWENSDGTTLETDTDVAEGTTPTYDGATPTKATDEKYMYFFSGWSPEVTAVTGDITYTAQFDKQVIGLYLMEGDVVDKDETIRFPLVYRGNEFSGHVLKVYLDGELVKSVEVQGASSIEPDRYYTTTQKCIVSQFSKGSTWPTIYNTIYLTSLHTVTWQNADGTVLETDTDVAEGTVPTYDGTTPTKAEDAQYTYTFTGWSPEVTAATEDVTYTATYTATPKPAEPTTDVSFTKVTDASQITAENIGTCTADEAAAWIVANWDSIELVPNQATLFAFYSDGVLCGFATGDYITKAEFEEHPENFIVTDVPLSVFVDAFNAGKIYLCTPSAAPAEPNNETSITVADTINEKFYLDKDFYEEAYGENVYVGINYNHNSDVNQAPDFDTDVKAMSSLPVEDDKATFDVTQAPAQVTEDVTINIYASQADAQAGINAVDTVTTSTYKYCRTIITTSNDAELVALAESALDYAAAAQTFFNYNTANMATKDAQGGFYGNVEGADLSGVEGFTALPSCVRNATMVIKSNLAINLLANTAIDVTDASIDATNSNFAYAPVYQNGDFFVIHTEGIEPANMDAEITIETSAGEIVFTANTIMRVMANSSDANKATLAKAGYLYGVAANNYFE